MNSNDCCFLVHIIMPIAAILLFLYLSLLPHSTEGKEADLILLTDPGEAVCLDGSPPGYYFRPGIGAGANNWIVHLQGGGWCYDEDACLGRSKGPLGSSKKWAATANFDGLLSDVKEDNPDFYQWNVVCVNYCDGASFAGYVEKPVDVQGTSIYFRGFKILQAVMQSVMDKGMSKAEEVILTGCSAGGLATYLHTDYVKSLLSPTVKFHAIADAGYFIDAPNIDGKMLIRGLYTYVFNMQNCSDGVNQKCITANTATNETWKCFMAQYTYPHISAPIFALNSQIDTWQLGNILQLGCTPPRCTPTQMEKFEQFYEEFKKASAPIVASTVNGAFLDSCLTHCQSLSSKSWTGTLVQNQTAAATFSNWYYNKVGIKNNVDCAYPCNKSC